MNVCVDNRLAAHNENSPTDDLTFEVPVEVNHAGKGKLAGELGLTAEKSADRIGLFLPESGSEHLSSTPEGGTSDEDCPPEVRPSLAHTIGRFK
jgi:hypothetical protein